MVNGATVKRLSKQEISIEEKKELIRWRNEVAVRLDLIDKMSDDVFAIFGEMNKILKLPMTVKDDRRKKYSVTEVDKYIFGRNSVLEFMEMKNEGIDENEQGVSVMDICLNEYWAFISDKSQKHKGRKDKEEFTIEKS